MKNVELPVGFEVKFHDFCNGCQSFKPCLSDDSYILYTNNKANVHHIITCEHYKECENIAENIKDNLIAKEAFVLLNM